jgi:mRNA interferase MazF
MDIENKIRTYSKIVTRGDIVWLKKDLSFNLGENVQDIHRPYVVISNNTNNDLCPTINLACLSKQVGKANYPMHVLVCGNKYGLDFDSVIYVEQIITINKKEIADKIARLDAYDLKKLDKAIFIQLIDEKQTIYA